MNASVRLRVLPQILPVDGRDIELQVTATYIQWRYVTDQNGSYEWTDLIAIVELIGPEGPATEFQVGDGYVQYRTVGADDWINLVALTDLTGPQGDPGPKGDPGDNSLDSRAFAVSSFHPLSAPNKIQTAGYAAPGDGGAALYAVAVSEPSHSGKFAITLADGVTAVWYEIASPAFNVLMFGATGDGVTDDTSAVQAAIDTMIARGRGSLSFPKGDYKMTAGLTASGSNIALQGEPGAKLDWSALAGNVNALTITGTGRGTSTTLSANLASGVYTASLTSAASFSDNSWVQVTAEDAYDFDGSTLVKRAEIKRLRSLSGTTATFDQAVYEAYTTANTATIWNVAFLDNVVVDGLELIGNNVETDNTYGIRAYWVNGLKVKNCRFINFRTYNLAVANCIDFDIDGNYFDGIRYTGAGSTFYGVVFLNSAQWGVIRGNTGREVRHLVTSTASQSDYGQPYFVSVQTNVLNNAEAGTAQASWAYENHGFGRWISWIGNIADSCHTGINLERGDQIVANNIFRNCRINGMVFGDTAAGRDLKNIIVIGNLFGKSTADNTTDPFYGIQFPPNANSVRSNILISGNTIEGFGASGLGDFGIRVYAGSGAAKDLVIIGNIFVNLNAHESTDYGTYIAQDGVTIRNNTYRNYERTIVIAASNCDVVGNTISVDTIASTLSAVQVVSGANNAVLSNIFRGCYRGVGITAGATGTKVAGNTQYGTTQTAVSDAGTGTVLNFGGVSGF